MSITNTVLLAQVINAPTTATVTNSITDPGATDLILLRIASGLTSVAAAPTSVTGMGRTWTLVAQGSIPNGNANQAVYRSQGAGSTGPLTINYAAAPANAIVTAISFSGVVTTGVNGADAVRQVAPVASIAATGISATYGSALGTGTATASFLVYNAGVSNTMTPPDVDATKIGSDQTATGPVIQTSAAFDPTAETQTDWTTDNAGGKVLIAVELAPATATAVVCNAGADQIDVPAFSTVTLTFSASGGTGPYSYLVDAPPEVTDMSGTGNTRTFTAPPDTAVQTLDFTVTAVDSLSASDDDIVSVTVLPHNLWTMRSGVLVGKNKKSMAGGTLI